MSSNDQYFNPEAKVVHSTQYLPHWQQEDKWYFVTWRMSDALPKKVIEGFIKEKAEWLKVNPEPWNTETKREYYTKFAVRVEKWLDQGHGSCLLRDRQYSEVVAKAIEHFDEQRYAIATYVIMPNHVHVLFRLNSKENLGKVMHSWRSFTAHKINKMRGEEGRLWQGDYWDTLIRSERHFFKVVNYIEENGNKAGLKENEYCLRRYKRRNNGAFV